LLSDGGLKYFFNAQSIAQMNYPMRNEHDCSPLGGRVSACPAPDYGVGLPRLRPLCFFVMADHAGCRAGTSIACRS